VLLDEPELGGDSGSRTCFAQLHLEESLVARPGDPLILRFYSPVTSIAGGKILDASPALHKRFAEKVLEQLTVIETGDSGEIFAQKLLEAKLEGISRAEALDNSHYPEAVCVGERLYHRRNLDEQHEAIATLVEAYGRKFPLRFGIPKEEVRRRTGFDGGASEWNGLLQAMSAGGGWVVVGDKIAASSDGPPLSEDLAKAVRRRESALRSLGLKWPGTAVFSETQGQLGERSHPEGEFLRYLVDRGRAVQVASDYFVHSEVLAETTAALRRFFQQKTELSFADFRGLTGLTRKHGIPLLEYLDQAGITRRVGDLRQSGPGLT
jgi:selenocysteine-specific elongation factor